MMTDCSLEDANIIKTVLHLTSSKNIGNDFNIQKMKTIVIAVI